MPATLSALFFHVNGRAVWEVLGDKCVSLAAPAAAVRGLCGASQWTAPFGSGRRDVRSCVMSRLGALLQCGTRPAAAIASVWTASRPVDEQSCERTLKGDEVPFI